MYPVRNHKKRKFKVRVAGTVSTGALRPVWREKTGFHQHTIVGQKDRGCRQCDCHGVLAWEVTGCGCSPPTRASWVWFPSSRWSVRSTSDTLGSTCLSDGSSSALMCSVASPRAPPHSTPFCFLCHQFHIYFPSVPCCPTFSASVSPCRAVRGLQGRGTSGIVCVRACARARV